MRGRVHHGETCTPEPRRSQQRDLILLSARLHEAFFCSHFDTFLRSTVSLDAVVSPLIHVFREKNESTRLRMEESLPIHHEDHITGKGENSLHHYNLVHKFIPMPQAMKIPAAKAAVDKEWEKLEKISAWNLTTKVRSYKKVIDEARTSGAKSS